MNGTSETARRGAAYGWMTLGCVLFALMNLSARFASRGMPWPIIACSRAAVGALVAFGVGRVRGSVQFNVGTKSMWARSVSGTVSMICTFFAFGAKDLSLGDTCTIFALTPILIAIAAPHFLGEPTDSRAWVVLAISTLGLLLVFRPPVLFGGEHMHLGATLPAMVALLGAVSAAFAMMMLRRIGREERPSSPETVVLHFSLTATLVLSFVAIPSVATAHPDLRSTLATVGAGVCAGFAQLAMTRAYTLENAARLGAFGNLTVVMSAIGSVAFLGEGWTAYSAVGMFLVVMGSLTLSLGRTRMAEGVLPVPDVASLPPPPVR